MLIIAASPRIVQCRTRLQFVSDHPPIAREQASFTAEQPLPCYDWGGNCENLLLSSFGQDRRAVDGSFDARLALSASNRNM
jgi:hypothetical protein